MKFIAEIGVNHLGCEASAINYCNMLQKTAVEAVTLQIREDSFYDGSTLWKRPLSKECYRECQKSIVSSDKLFGIAISDLAAARNYADLSPDFWKVLSWGIKDVALIQFLLDTGSAVYISTGISGMAEIKRTAELFDSKVQFIHTQLSTDVEDVNLLALSTMRQSTECEISLGLHCDNLNVIKAAVAFQPSAIFLYVKEKQDVEYPDGSYAVPLENLDAIIAETEILSKSVGNGVKQEQKPSTLSDRDKPNSLR